MDNPKPKDELSPRERIVARMLEYLTADRKPMGTAPRASTHTETGRDEKEREW